MQAKGMTHGGGYEKSAHLYDLFDNKPNVEFFLHHALQAGEILDVGAGTGRIALVLASHGVKVFCVEPSPAMRREFQRRLEQQPDVSLKIQVIAGRAEDFRTKRTFPAAFLSGVFDHFLDDRERLAALTNIRLHLVPEGLLVFDVFLGLMQDAPLSPAGEVDVGDTHHRRFVGGQVLAGSKKETTLVFETFRGGTLIDRIEERSLVGIVSRESIHRALLEAGFRVEREYGDYDFTPYRTGDSLLVLEAVNQA